MPVLFFFGMGLWCRPRLQTGTLSWAFVELPTVRIEGGCFEEGGLDASSLLESVSSPLLLPLLLLLCPCRSS